MNNIVRRQGEGSLSLADKIRDGLSTLREQKAELQAVQGRYLILDVSGSMAGEVEGRRKIDHLRAAVGGFPQAQVVAFGGSRVTVGSIPEPSGNTNMAAGFEALRGQALERAILISDGLPDSPEAALTAAVALRRPVDVLYIGPAGDEGEAFMRRLAEATGGRQITVPPGRGIVPFREALTVGVQRLALTWEAERGKILGGDDVTT